MTDHARSAIITAGRDDALWMASPSVRMDGRLPVGAGWRLTFSSSCSSCRDPNESRLRQKVGNLWFPSFRKAKTADGSNQRFEAQRREATIMTTEIISKSDMISPPSTFVFRGEKPSAICFLPAGSPWGLHGHYSIWMRNVDILNIILHIHDKREAHFRASLSFSSPQFPKSVSDERSASPWWRGGSRR